MWLWYNAGLLVTIAYGKIATASREFRNVPGSPTAIVCGLIGGILEFLTGFAIIGRIFLRGFCPDFTPVSRDLNMHEQVNQVAVAVATETTEILRRQSNPVP